MRKIIIKILEEHQTYSKKIEAREFYSVAQYEYGKDDLTKKVMPGQTLVIKVGNQYIRYLTYEDAMEQMNESNLICTDQKYTIEDMFNSMISGYDTMYYVNRYLPRY